MRPKAAEVVASAFHEANNHSSKEVKGREGRREGRKEGREGGRKGGREEGRKGGREGREEGRSVYLIYLEGGQNKLKG